MITCVIKGGLCNQLFQIFATIAYCIKYKHEFIFPYETILSGGVTVRKTYWNDFLISLRKLTTYNSHITNYDLNNYFLKEFPDHHFCDIPNFQNEDNIKLEGYFQSYKYFEEYQDYIFNLIDLDYQLNYIKNGYNHFFKPNDIETYTIAMHFRLGDYKHLQHSHNILPIDYYMNALKHILTNDINNIKNKKIKVLYFCEKEDNEYVNNIINKLIDIDINIQFLKVYDTINDWQQLLLMACCTSNIIANSTYSWWGAYFNKNKNKIVCYPSVWFGPCLNTLKLNDMFPLSWVQIDIK
jgi:hypothetical protein